MVEKILDFHQSLTNNQFIEKQKYCREIWKTYLSKEGFIKHFNDIFYKRVNNKKCISFSIHFNNNNKDVEMF